MKKKRDLKDTGEMEVKTENGQKGCKSENWHFSGGEKHHFGGRVGKFVFEQKYRSLS
jgi:hypothetical protein